MRSVVKRIIEPVHGALQFSLPSGARLLSVGQDDVEGASYAAAWWLVDSTEPLAICEFYVALPGYECPAWVEYAVFEEVRLLTSRGTFMLHIFQREEL